MVGPSAGELAPSLCLGNWLFSSMPHKMLDRRYICISLCSAFPPIFPPSAQRPATATLRRPFFRPARPFFVFRLPPAPQPYPPPVTGPRSPRSTTTLQRSRYRSLHSAHAQRPPTFCALTPIAAASPPTPSSLARCQPPPACTAPEKKALLVTVAPQTVLRVEACACPSRPCLCACLCARARAAKSLCLTWPPLAYVITAIPTLPTPTPSTTHCRSTRPFRLLPAAWP